MDALNTNTRSEKVARYYAPLDLEQRISEGLRKMGKDPDKLAPEDLAPVDQFHTGGREATLELAALAGLRSGMKVIDLGGGLGGPARTVAASLFCEVTVLDLSAEFCRAGEWLTRATGLSERVHFHVGDAVATPFPDASFDGAWTQHSTMNIADKAAFYREAFRLLRPGGLLAMHEIMAGNVQPIHFPVPWASEPDISALAAPAEMRELALAAGFIEVAWLDQTEAGRSWYLGRVAALAAGGGPPPLGLHLVIGERFFPAFASLVRNANEQRIAIFQGVFRRPESSKPGSPEWEAR